MWLIVDACGAKVDGAINYDAWALSRNLETALLFEDAAKADRGVSEFVEPGIAVSQTGERPDGLTDRLRHWFWGKFTYCP